MCSFESRVGRRHFSPGNLRPSSKPGTYRGRPNSRQGTQRANEPISGWDCCFAKLRIAWVKGVPCETSGKARLIAGGETIMFNKKTCWLNSQVNEETVLCPKPCRFDSRRFKGRTSGHTQPSFSERLSSRRKVRGIAALARPYSLPVAGFRARTRGFRVASPGVGQNGDAYPQTYTVMFI